MISLLIWWLFYSLAKLSSKWSLTYLGSHLDAKKLQTCKSFHKVCNLTTNYVKLPWIQLNVFLLGRFEAMHVAHENVLCLFFLGWLNWIILLEVSRRTWSIGYFICCPHLCVILLTGLESWYKHSNDYIHLFVNQTTLNFLPVYNELCCSSSTIFLIYDICIAFHSTLSARTRHTWNRKRRKM